MATIIVEDGTGVTGANSYVTVAELTSYASDRDITIHHNHGDESELLIKAMDYFEQQPFKGIKKTELQPLQFPRTDLWIDSYLSDSNAIPVQVKTAQMAIAIEIMEGNDPLSAIERATKREKVDVLEVEYMDGAAPDTVSRSIGNIMRKLVTSSSMGNNFTSIRG